VLEDLWIGGRICNYCGVNMDSPHVDEVRFFHETCWQEYRKAGRLYPMPKYAGYSSSEALGEIEGSQCQAAL
jgi:hypothetical protein